MPELTRAALPFTVLACGLAVLLCLAPLLGSRGRTVIAILFLLFPLGFGIDLLVIDHSPETTLEVPNFFGRAGETEPHRWVTAVVKAPAAYWHLFVMAWMTIPGVLLLVRRHRPRAVPEAVWYFGLVFAFFLGFRLGLELTAAPIEVVWGFGATPTLLVTLPFFGLYCGRGGHTFGRFWRRLLVCALLQRLLLITFAYFATKHQLGTHLDTHVVTDVKLPLFGEHRLDNAFDQWFWSTAVVHMVFWVLTTLIAGLLLGSLPRWWSSRKVAVIAD